MKHPDSHRYDDIIHLERPASPRRPMPRADRAAQFSPFAALTGYEAAIQETARLTDEFMELSEDAKAELNEKFLLLHEAIATRPAVTVTFFREDVRKSGGAYHTLTDRIRKVSASDGVLLTEGGEVIPLAMIQDIQCELFLRMNAEYTADQP